MLNGNSKRDERISSRPAEREQRTVFFASIQISAQPKVRARCHQYLDEDRHRTSLEPCERWVGV